MQFLAGMSIVTLFWLSSPYLERVPRMIKIAQQDWFIETNTGSAIGLALQAKLHEERSEYQKIEVYATETFGHLMVIDDCTMVTQRDNFIYHEMMTHPALFTHPNPRRVVIIGGGDCGTLQQVLLHPSVEKVTQIDIDERVTRLAEQYFPELCANNGDPRAELLFADGVRWIQESPAGSVDLIIVDSTDPVGPAAGLFSAPFFRDCLQTLAPGGMVVQQSESPLLHAQSIIQPMHREMRKAGFAQTRTLLFPLFIYPSGWWSATMACKDGEFAPFRAADARNKPFATQYYNADVHQACFALPNFLQALLADS